METQIKCRDLGLNCLPKSHKRLLGLHELKVSSYSIFPLLNIVFILENTLYVLYSCLHAKKVSKAKKNIELFLMPFFKKQMRQGGFIFSFLFRQKTDAGTIFSKLRTIFFKSCACTVISSDIIQVRP